MGLLSYEEDKLRTAIKSMLAEAIKTNDPDEYLGMKLKDLPNSHPYGFCILSECINEVLECIGLEIDGHFRLKDIA